MSLGWDGLSDLDLAILCPNGNAIGFNNQLACGARLDVDMNAGSRSSSTPIENVYWPSKPANGVYQVYVTLFDRRSDRREAIPFRVELDVLGDRRQVDGAARQLPPGRAGDRVRDHRRAASRAGRLPAGGRTDGTPVMLKPLTEWSKTVTLVPYSGVQFLDFGFNLDDTRRIGRSFIERPDRSLTLRRRLDPAALHPALGRRRAGRPGPRAGGAPTRRSTTSTRSRRSSRS